jgi:DNA-binding beta-propeller fold protein YncE
MIVPGGRFWYRYAAAMNTQKYVSKRDLVDAVLGCLLLAAPAMQGEATQHPVQPGQPSQTTIQTTVQTIDLPSSKQLLGPVPGGPERTNSLPMAMVVSPDGRYLVLLDAGYGTYESKYEQSLAVLDTATGQLTDFPDARTGPRARQTLYSGLAFSSDGRRLYASMASLTNPQGDAHDAVGNGIAVYSFAAGKVTPERFLPIPLQPLAPGKKQDPMEHAPVPVGMANPYPSGLAVVKTAEGGDALLVANDLSDNAVLMDAASGKGLYAFDLSTAKTVPASYPIAVTATPDGSRGFVALWNGSAVAELDLRSGRVLGTLSLLAPSTQTAPSSHPTALLLNQDASILYVALANRDAVAAVSIGRPRGAHAGKQPAMRLLGLFDTRLPGQSFFGAVPDALALSPDGKRLYVADASLDAVAVFRLRKSTAMPAAPVRPLGFLPTEWYPTALAASGGKLYIATAKGKGTGPNNMPQRVVAGSTERYHPNRTYIPTLLYGSLATVDRADAERRLVPMTQQVLASNLLRAAQQTIRFRNGGSPIRHVIYILKENRSYDQVFGDLKAGNNDPSLTMYGRAITPNQHKLAEQFGVIDDFYDSGEVSGDGHVWSTAGITSDYTEKTWQQGYRGNQRTYDYEGVVADAYPLLQGVPDVNEPASGYLWTNLARHGKSYYHFGEYVSTRFCNGPGAARQGSSPQQGTPGPTPMACQHSFIRKGDPIPANYGGGTSQYPWDIPLIARNVATKPELVGHFDPLYADFNLQFPDQLRVAEFLMHFRAWVSDRAQGKDTMPSFVLLRLPDDHTAGTRPGSPRPEASVADNDLAVGRAVEAVSHSAYWKDTAFFILEDDAQNGADHVDAHRSILLVVSKYAPRPRPDGTPFVDHHFYTTVSALRTMETLLGLPPMNNNDAFAPLLAPLFTGNGTQPAFDADYSNRDNGRIYAMNTAKSYGAKQSSRMDFRHADMADTQKLNVILWRDAMGDKPVPAALLVPHPRHANADGD